MSDTPTPSAHDETGQALARLAALGKESLKSNVNWGVLLLGLLCLVPLAAVGGLAWLQFTQQDELAALRTDYTALQQQSAGNSNQFALLQDGQQLLGVTLQQSVREAVQQDLVAANAALAAQTERLAALESELAATRLRLNSMDTGGSPLAEAEVLLRFAQQRLLLAHDTVTAAELFRAADELLRGIDDPALFTVRDILARELALLQAVPPVDVPGLFAQLSAQAARVADFTVVSASAAQDFAVTPVENSVQEEGGWWSGIKQTLGDYFVVTQSTEEVAPQLDAETQFLLRALIQLRIEQAKLALLRAEPELYQAALDEALASSRQWLRGDEASLASYLSALDTLRATPIMMDISRVDDTLAALRLLPGATPVVAPEAQP